MASALTYSQQRGDVIRVLMRDYSDITGTAAKLSLLASPCAWGALELELWPSVCLCVCVWYVGAYWASCAGHGNLHYSPSIHLPINVSFKKNLPQLASQNSICDVHSWVSTEWFWINNIAGQQPWQWKALQDPYHNIITQYVLSVHTGILPKAHKGSWKSYPKQISCQRFVLLF